MLQLVIHTIIKLLHVCKLSLSLHHSSQAESASLGKKSGTNLLYFEIALLLALATMISHIVWYTADSSYSTRCKIQRQ